MEANLTYKEAMKLAGIAYWTALLDKHGGQFAAAAREAEVNRTDGYKLLQRYGLSWVPQKMKDARARPNPNVDVRMVFNDWLRRQARAMKESKDERTDTAEIRAGDR